MSEQTYSSSDVKRAKQNAGRRKRREQEISRIVTEYKQGRGASSCMSEIIKIIEGN
jgi:hypothetical protein